MTTATTSATTTKAKTPDYDEIIRVVQLYLDGFRGDVNKLNEKVGERGASQAAELRRFEIELCERYLPKGMDEGALRALVAERLETLGITDAKQAGRVVGDVMKTHKGQVEAADVKRVVDELLTPQA